VTCVAAMDLDGPGVRGGHAWMYIPCGDTDMSLVFEILDEPAIPRAGLAEPRSRREPWQERD
jgi:hypothetical protein